MFYLYLLQSLNHKRTYIGISANVDKRFSEHNAGSVKSTKAYIPYKIIHVEEFQTKTEARKREVQLKNHSQTKEILFKSLGLR